MRKDWFCALYSTEAQAAIGIEVNISVPIFPDLESSAPEWIRCPLSTEEGAATKPRGLLQRRPVESPTPARASVWCASILQFQDDSDLSKCPTFLHTEF